MPLAGRQILIPLIVRLKRALFQSCTEALRSVSQWGGSTVGFTGCAYLCARLPNCTPRSRLPCRSRTSSIERKSEVREYFTGRSLSGWLILYGCGRFLSNVPKGKTSLSPPKTPMSRRVILDA